MQTLFFLSLGLIALAAVTMFINIIFGITSNKLVRVMIVHMITVVLYIFGLLGTIGFGVNWIVQALSK